MTRTAAAVVALLLAAIPCSAAGDEDEAAAKKLADTAYDLAKAGRWDDAIDLYLKAHDLSPKPAFLFNVARCHEKKGDSAAARDGYVRFLDSGGDADLRAAAQKALERLPEGPPGPRPAGAGRIEVVASVEGASVRIDDRVAGTAPLAPVEAAPGRHSVTVTREGYADFFTTVVVAAGETARVDAVLQRSGPGRDPAPTRDASPHRTPGRGRTEPAKPAPAAAMTATAPPPPDLPAAVRGAETLPAGRAAFYLDAGYPSLGLGFHARAREGLDVVPHADFSYARDVTAPFLGAGAGVRLKLRLVAARGFALAAVLDPAVTYMFEEGAEAVILRLIAPWLVASYRFSTAGVTLYGGLKSPIEFVVHPSFVALLPVVGHLGVEVALSGTMSVALEADMGAEWVAAPDRATTKALAPSGRFGFAVRF